MSYNFDQLLDTHTVYELFDSKSIVYLTLSLVIFFVAKKIYQWIVPYDLNHELVDNDNSAVAVSVSGYFFGVGIILWGILSDSSAKLELSKKEFHLDLLLVLMWGLTGILLLQLARIINDKWVLSKFKNIKEIVTDRNIGTAAVQFGAFVGSALIIRGSLIGEGQNLLISILGVLLYFCLGQLAFILYAKFSQLVVSYDIHDEIEKDNIAAGVSFGAGLIAEGILISGYMEKHDSLLGLLVWFIIGTLCLYIARLLVDRFIIPGNRLDAEIKDDRNWGAALIEGSTAIIFAFILNAAF